MGAIGSMQSISKQESNASNHSNESSASMLLVNTNLTLMGGQLNHMGSSPVQVFKNPNIGAPKLEIPPSQLRISTDTITPNSGHSEEEKHEILIDKASNENSDMSKDNVRHHPITPNTEASYNMALPASNPMISPAPPHSNDSINVSVPNMNMSELTTMAQYMPEVMNALKYLTQNVANIQQQINKMNNKQLSEQRLRSQSNSSNNSLRTQTSFASTITSFNDASYTSIPSRVIKRRHSTIPGAKTEKTSTRKNIKKKNKKKEKGMYLDAQKQSATYNNYTQKSRRISLGPGNHSSASSPKAATKLTADSLELWRISQREAAIKEKEKKKKKSKVRKRSKSFLVTAKDKLNGMQDMQKRPSVNMLKIKDDDDEYTDDDELLFFDHEDILYSDDSDQNDMHRKLRMIPNKLSIIHSASDHHFEPVSFEESEGGNNVHSKFRRKQKNVLNNSKNNVITKRKPSSPSNASNMSSFSNISQKIDFNKNESNGISRSVPQSPALGNKEKVNNKKRDNVFTFNTKKRNKNKPPLLMQSETNGTNTTSTPQRPNTPKGQMIKPIMTPNNSPNDANPMGPPVNIYDTVDIKNINSLTLPITQQNEDYNDLGRLPFDLEPLMFSDNEEMGMDKVEIVADEAVIVNGDQVRELLIHNGHRALVGHGNNSHNLVEEAANILFADTSSLPLKTNKYTDKTGEDSVSTKLPKIVHFQHFEHTNMPIKFEESSDDMDENEALISIPKRIIKRKQKGKLNIRNKLRTSPNRLSRLDLLARNTFDQLKSKLLHVSRMTDEEINWIHNLILDEKKRRECCVQCNDQNKSLVVLLPCAHQNVCFNCSENLRYCPVCNKTITDVIKPRR